MTKGALFKNPEEGEVESYLESTGMDYFVKGEAIQFPCPHGDCDTNREHPNKRDFHCSINTITGQYHCVKCNASGNLVTLKQLFGHPSSAKSNKSTSYASSIRSPEKIAIRCHKDLMSRHQDYVNYLINRGISLYKINECRLGCGEFYGKMWITIPITEDGVCTCIKLRRPPDDDERTPKYIFYPRKGSEATVFGGDELLKSSSDSVLICGGELDKIVADQMDFEMPAISGTAGEGTFRKAWVDKYLYNRRNVYICFDADEAGKKSTKLLADLIETSYPKITIFKVVIPETLGDHADLTDANLADITADQLLSSAEHIGGSKPIDKNNFREMSVTDLTDVLNLTIKYDDVNKVVIFLAMLSTYTADDQLNIFLNAQSSSGKSYIVQEVAKYFPQTDILDFCKVTPTAFFYNENRMRTGDDGETYIDLERKILIFYDQVDTQLQSNLRSLLSHDKKKLPFMNTNKGKNGANSAKTLYLLGFPSTFFCSANMKMDEQEQTRAFLLSPEVSQEKLNASIDLVQTKMGNKSDYDKMLESNQDRQLLIDRVLYIKWLGVQDIIIPTELGVVDKFKGTLQKLQPRNQRDIQHLNSLIKAITLLNAPFRMVEDQNLVATQGDVDQALELWTYLNRSQRYGIPPQTLDFYEQIILPAFRAKQANLSDTSSKIGVTIKELSIYSVKVTNSTLNQNYCRNQYLPVLEASGLIACEKNPDNRKELLIVPLELSLGESEKNIRNTETDGKISAVDKKDV